MLNIEEQKLNSAALVDDDNRFVNKPRFIFSNVKTKSSICPLIKLNTKNKKRSQGGLQKSFDGGQYDSSFKRTQE